MPVADSAPGECFSVARYRLLHHTAVSFVSSDIRVFCRVAVCTCAGRPLPLWLFILRKIQRCRGAGARL